MEKQLIIIFGLPGSGKSYVAKVLENRYGFTIYDGDKEIPSDMKKALFVKKIITDDMRKHFNEAMLVTFNKLSKEVDKLVFMQALLKDDLRRKIHEIYPKGKFILVQTKDYLREKRYVGRQKFNLGLNYLRQTSKLFEKPTIHFVTINNNLEGSKNIIKQLNKIINTNNTNSCILTSSCK